ncbi:MAG: S1 RNA-binding domain-containing protein [Proteobacteria bacterium]|nr:S1 RNA-binding domain-containing protein [Pseudomonadota bacterium]
MSEEKIEMNPQKEGDTIENTEEEESFALLFEKTSKLPGRLDPGQKVVSKVVSISGDFVYVDMDGKSEGAIDLKEFKDEKGNYSIQIGDEIEAFFASFQNGVKRLTTMKHGLSILNLGGIHDAYDANLPVSGKVTGELKGGFEVHIGKARCFCPFSQMDLKGSREKEAYLGQVFSFKVVEYGEDGRNIILSRRALLEEEREIELEKVRQTLEVGMEVEGTIRSILKFGAFIDLGGIDGLIPLSEIGWGRTENTEDVLSVGQKVTVKIIGIDWGKNRLTLSLKATQLDPFLSVAEKYPVDSQVHGTIVRLTPFGAFVNLEPGIDGLIHISRLGAGRRIKHPKEVVEEGQVVDVYVHDVDPKNKRISLSMESRLKRENVDMPQVSDILDSVVEKALPSGVIVRLLDGATGFIPNSEMGTPRGSNHNKMFPVGTAMQVIVKEVNSARNRITLSRSGVSEKLEQEELNKYRDKIVKDEKTDSSLGSLGELIKAAMEKNKKTG